MPKFPGVLLNNNPNAPSIDLNDLQVKGVGIFADVAERDALDANIQTEGYLAIMKDDDTIYVYKGGGWTTTSNWDQISGKIEIQDGDGTPSGSISTLIVPDGNLSVAGETATLTFSGLATSTQLSELQTEVDSIETSLGLSFDGNPPTTAAGDFLISDGTNFGVSAYSLPTADGTVGQYLQTDGNGQLSFVTISATLEGLTDTPSGYGTSGQVLTTNGTDAFTFTTLSFTASAITTDTSNFNGVLSASDTTVQAALDTLDGLSLTLEGLSDTPSGYGTDGQVLITNGVDGFTFGSGSPWDEVAYTGQTAIKYENGVVGIKDSAVSYSTNANLLAKAGQFPIDTGTYSSSALMHLHEGQIITTTDNSSTGFIAASFLGTSHASSDYGSIGLYNRKAWISGGEGVYLGSGGTAGISTYITSPGTSGQIKIGKTNFDGAGGIQLSGDTGPASNYHKIVMGGQIVFHGHTASKYVAISRRGNYGTDGGVQISGGTRTGLFAHFAASDPNTQGTYGYLGINVNTPQVNGPAFEVSSSYAKFNNGLHIGDITATGYSFPTATGNEYQALVVDSNGDLVFSDSVGYPDANFEYRASFPGGDINGGVAGTSNGKALIWNKSGIHNTLFLGHDPDVDGGYNNGNGSIRMGGSISADGTIAAAGGFRTSGSVISITTESGGGSSIVMGSFTNSAANMSNSISMGIYTYQNVPSGATYNIAIGRAAMRFGGGSHNIGMGLNAVYSSSGSDNIGLGNSALQGSTSTGSRNIGIGKQAGSSFTTGSNNVFLGYQAGSSTTTGSDNTIIGTGNAPNLTTQSNNVIIGHDAVTGASWNFGSSVVIGYQAGQNVSGSTGQGGGIFIGSNSGNWSQNYYGNNVNIGKDSGNASVAIGENAGANGGGGLYGTIIGRNARGSGTVIGADAVGGGKVAIGQNASAAANHAIAIGGTANYIFSQSIGGTVNGNYGVAIGANSAEANSVAIGYSLLSGSANTIQIGTFNAAYHSTQVSTGTPSENILVGNNVLLHTAAANANAITDYVSNVLIGSSVGNYPSGSLSSNVIVGQSAYSSGDTSYTNETGSNNVIIGHGAGRGLPASLNGSNRRPLSGNVIIGYEAAQDQAISNKLYIANSNTTTPLIYGEFDNYHVKFNGSYAGSAIGFWPGNDNTNDHVAIGDQDYMGSGSATSFAGLQILFDSTIGSADFKSGLWIGKKWNVGIVKNDALMIGNRITYTATSGNVTPKILIGNGANLGSTNNNASGIIIGLSGTLAYNIGSGVVIGGDRGSFNGVAIKASNSGVAGSQGGTVIMGEPKDYSVIIGGPQRAGVGQSGNGQKTIIGNAAANSSTAHTAIGAYTAHSSSGTYITAVGAFALGNQGVGGGSATTAVGQNAGQRSTGANNTFIGALAAGSNTTGSSNVAIGGGLGAGGSGALIANTTGGKNTSIGVNSLRSAVAASNNIAIGYDSGYKAGGSNNIFLGYRIAFVGTDNDTAITNNVIIGHQAGYNVAGAGNVMLGAGAGGVETGSNKLYIANSNTTTPLIYGEFDNDIVKINGDFEVTGSDGVTLTSPNGTRYKVTVTDAGALSVTTA